MARDHILLEIYMILYIRYGRKPTTREILEHILRWS